MLSKLIRYEWKAVARVCIPMYGGLILAAMLTHFLLGNLGFFFIPVSVSIINYVDLIWQNAAAFLTVCVVSMVLTYGATVWAVHLTRRLMERGGKRK